MARTTAAADGSASDSRSSAAPPPPNLADAATPIPLPREETTFLVGTNPADVPVRPIFDDAVLRFLSELSGSLLADRRYPDVTAFALWCRRSELERKRESYQDGDLHLGRGLVFHVSPANVPIMFAYTLAIGLLAGNANVVKLPSRPADEVDHLCARIGELLDRPEHRALAGYLTCIRYNRAQVGITRLLSAACDVRVIWGGDRTVRQIRQSPLPAGGYDMVFPDRYSVAVIDSGAWLRCTGKRGRIRGFYNDSYPSGQMSCSSPRLVLWLGDDVEAARADFWGLLDELVAERHRPAPLDASRRLEYAYGILARHPEARIRSTRRIWCPELTPDLLDDHPGGGVFVESGSPGVEALAPLLRRRCQTIASFGVPAGDLAALLRRSGARGGHRIVPIGGTLDFSLIWDGYDTIRTLSRTLSITLEDTP